MSKQETITGTTQIVIFSLENEETKKTEYYSMPIEYIKEIIEVPAITNIPNTKEDVIGMINLRDSLLPVVDLKKKIGLPSHGLKENSKQKILVAELDNKLTGFLVDNVDEVIQLAQNNIDAIPSENSDSMNYFIGVIKIEEKLIVLLNVKKMLNIIRQDVTHESKNDPKNTDQKLCLDQETSDEIPAVLKEVFAEEAQDQETS